MMAAPPRYTLVQNEEVDALFAEIWQQYPRLAGKAARTIRLALESLADGVPQNRTEPDRTGQNVTPDPPLDIPDDEIEVADDIFAGVEI